MAWNLLKSFGRGIHIKKVIFLMIWIIGFLLILELRKIDLDVSVPQANSRFLFRRHFELYESTVSEDNDIVLAIDRRPKPSEDELVEDIQKRMPNLPFVYWNKHKNKKMGFKDSCAKYPSMFDLEFNNIYWQTLRTSNGTFQLFGAYLDNRLSNRLGPTVRILGMIDRIQPTVRTFCQLWFDGKREPALVETFKYDYIWNKKWGNYKQNIYQPYLIACVLPQVFRHKVPVSVSVVENMCDTATNSLRVIYNKPKTKKNFAVCVKGLDFLHEDLSVRLVEWIELLNILGAEKIYFYDLKIHPNITKVLKHYENEGKVELTPMILAGGQPNAASFQHLYLAKKTTNKRQNELIPYNDCFYKHMYEYKYIVLLDIDEVIMPKEVSTWKELIDIVLPKALKRKKERASYNVRNVYFLDDLMHNREWFQGIPKYMHMMQHVYRAKNFTKPGHYVKCFHNTEKVLTLHNHYPFSCLENDCTSYSIEVDDAQLHHYRADCVRTLRESCKEFRRTSVMDTTIWRYKDALTQRVSSTLRILGFFDISAKETANLET